MAKTHSLPPSRGTPPTNLRGLYLSALGLIQLIAYWSYYIQFPGLLSSSGLEPVERIFAHAAPSLYEQWIRSGFIDEDSFCEILALSGMAISALIATGVCQNALLFAINLACYGFLVRTGGTFYSFQWDMLLLETTAITCMTYAPWLKSRVTNETTTLPVAPIPLRFLLFKLMYMSGVVKLQSHCKTWTQLTALEYHFATQCLPTPLAWYAHQLHPVLLRLGVATTLWLEIPATVLLVVPLAETRRIGASLQILLQVLIILTGNYNFFNLLTIALCIPVWDSPPNSDVRPSRLLEQSACWGYLLWTLYSMFRIEYAGDNDNMSIILVQDSMWIKPGLFLPLVPSATLALVAVTSMSTKSAPVMFHGFVCFLVVGIVAIPMSQIYSHVPLLRPVLGPWYSSYIQPYGLVNGYGLFRRMTGVGSVPHNAKGWAGLSPSVVARPEIILEGVYDSEKPFGQQSEKEEEMWEELNIFRWKPGAVDAMPWQVAPHQPRLDWQMWFAALGNINHNPWLVHLIQKLLDGCEPALDLVGADNPSKSATTQSRLLKIRAKLYHYDFTRANTTWSQSIPGAEILAVGSNTIFPAKVWTRKFAGDYLPAVESGDLGAYLRQQGYKGFCQDPENPCGHLVGNANTWCLFTTIIRSLGIYLIIPGSVLVRLVSKMLQQKRNVRSKSRLAEDKKGDGNLEEKKTQ